MDPAANLREQAQLADEMLHSIDNFDNLLQMTGIERKRYLENSARLAELVSAYCEWITKGGSPS